MQIVRQGSRASIRSSPSNPVAIPIVRGPFPVFVMREGEAT